MGILSGNPKNEPLHYGKYLVYGHFYLHHKHVLPPIRRC